MNVSAVGGSTPPVQPQRVAPPAPRDADGDRDGDTAARAPATPARTSSAPLVSNGTIDTYA